MIISGEHVSLYDNRVRIVADALSENSDLTPEAAAELAVHVLQALDHIPEHVR